MLGLGALSLAVVFAGTATAGTITYNSTLAIPTGGTSSVYFGTGNSDGAWTVDTESNGIELALRGAIRYQGPITPNGTPDSNYIAPSGTSNKNAAYWNFEYSIDLNPTGSGSTLDFSQVTETLTVQDLTDPTRSILTFNPVGNGVDGPSDDAKVGNIAAQNSENIKFFNSILANPFNLNANDTYQISLSVSNVNGAPLAFDSITVSATAPEPSSWLLLAAGAATCGMMLHRRKRLNGFNS
jgi:hypothetical protein